MNLNPKRIFLMGMPASGKSYLAKHVAQKLRLKYLDTDYLVELKANLSIPEIFEKYGESYFRSLEKTVVKQLLLQNEFVCALGGGTPTIRGLMHEMNKNAKTILIQSNLDILADRIYEQKSERPLFADLQKNEILKKLKELEENRGEFYQMAHLTVDMTGKSWEDFLYICQTQIIQ